MIDVVRISGGYAIDPNTRTTSSNKEDPVIPAKLISSKPAPESRSQRKPPNPSGHALGFGSFFALEKGSCRNLTRREVEILDQHVVPTCLG